MSYELARDAEQDLRDYLYYLSVRNPQASVNEAMRIHNELSVFATSRINGRIVQIQGWPRAILHHYMDPFHVYYEWRPQGLFVARLWHYARLPIVIP